MSFRKMTKAQQDYAEQTDRLIEEQGLDNREAALAKSLKYVKLDLDRFLGAAIDLRLGYTAEEVGLAVQAMARWYYEGKEPDRRELGYAMPYAAELVDAMKETCESYIDVCETRKKAYAKRATQKADSAEEKKEEEAAPKQKAATIRVDFGDSTSELPYTQKGARA